MKNVLRKRLIQYLQVLFPLDIAIGYRERNTEEYRTGRIIEIYGPESSGVNNAGFMYIGC